MMLKTVFKGRRLLVHTFGLLLLALPAVSFGRPNEPHNEQECLSAGGHWQVMSHITGEYGCYFPGRPPDDPARPSNPPPEPPALPDLAVSLLVRPSTSLPGVDIGGALQLTVSNVGDRVAPRGFLIDITFSGIPDVPRRSVLLKEIVSPFALAPGESRTYSISGAVIPFNERPGLASVCAIVDPRNTLREYTKNNNTMCPQISLSPNSVIFRPAVR